MRPTRGSQEGARWYVYTRAMKELIALAQMSRESHGLGRSWLVKAGRSLYGWQ